MIKRLFLLPLAVMLLLAALVGLLLAANLHSYYRLSDESLIAELQFVRTGDGRYDAIIAYGDFCNPERYALYGDHWRLDARFLKWSPWANLLGFDSLYRVERLSGRYREIDRENAGPREAHALHPRDGVDLVAVLAKYGGRFSPVDTLYGSSVYDEMNPDQVYRVYRSQSGLLVRHAPRPTADRSDGVTTIEITRSCAPQADSYDTARRHLKRLLDTGGD